MINKELFNNKNIVQNMKAIIQFKEIFENYKRLKDLKHLNIY